MSFKVYTKTGDEGQTSLVGGTRVGKNHQRIQAYGTVDELNSIIGVTLAHISPNCSDSMKPILIKIQNQLFNIGSHLACEKESFEKKLPALQSRWVTDLENDIDERDKELAPLKEFILPGGAQTSAHLHLARTVCRRAEREALAIDEVTDSIKLAITYLNRLSDHLFVLARHANHLEGHAEVTWSKE